MWRQSWITHMAVLGTLCLLATVSFAAPHTDPGHRSALPVTLTFADGTRHAAVLQGVGCTESMCSRVRAQDNRADSIWLDGLATVRQISGATSGPLHVVLGFRDGTARAATIRETNRILYLTDTRGRGRTLDLAALTQVDFQ
jgi:hypothetical protein